MYFSNTYIVIRLNAIILYEMDFSLTVCWWGQNSLRKVVGKHRDQMFKISGFVVNLI